MNNLNINTSSNGAELNSAPKTKGLNRKQKKLIFYISMIVFPIIQISIFYIYTNLNSIILSFKNYELVGDTTVITFAGFKNFSNAFKILGYYLYMIKNSLVLYAFNLCIGFSLALIFSFFIYKKYFGSKIFQVILFMPNLISGLVFSLIFKYIATDVYCTIFSQTEGLLDNLNTRFGTVIFYNIWMSFGINVMMFSGSMSGIDESLVEASKLDGANIVQEFIRLTIPMIFGTLTSFIIIGMVGIFTNQMSLYSLYDGTKYEIGTLGYYLYVESRSTNLFGNGLTFTEYGPQGTPSYSVLSAMGVILTIILIPLVMSVKKLLEKFGPSAE